jgi:hypothetical protein
VNPPDGFRLWKGCWFDCPYCGFHCFGAYALVRASFRRGGSVLTYCFWCPSCNRHSVLARPIVLLFAFLMVFALLFIVMFSYFEPLGWMILVPAVALGFLNSLVVFPTLTRLLNRYVPLDRSAGL